ncbi:chorismate synthase, chloroplastic-like [Zingiber officinale]|uniref:chorismate synthase, chloroplastic-like n=1 Tax=Zingiber officinale TaxID=94328 RepID=UPI001C4B3404|nr:chorismate synthase, chloroplastic-like [Zingiber officinale]
MESDETSKGEDKWSDSTSLDNLRLPQRPSTHRRRPRLPRQQIYFTQPAIFELFPRTHKDPFLSTELARETIGRVAAGAIAKKILKVYAGTEILAYVSQVHKVVLPEGVVDYETVTLDQIENNIVRCPDPDYAQKMIEAIDEVRVKGDSVGGIVTCIARNVPRGLGCPIFDKLEADLAKAMLSLSAMKGFEIGSGFVGTFLTGSEHNDEFFMDEHGNMRTRTNRSGGVQGGISNGETIYLRIAYKATSTIVGKKCNLAVKQRENMVAYDTILSEGGPNILIHHVPLGERNFKVSIDVVLDEEAELPIPIWSGFQGIMMKSEVNGANSSISMWVPKCRL